MVSRRLRRGALAWLGAVVLLTATAGLALAQNRPMQPPPPPGSAQLLYKVTETSQRQELTVLTSRILTMDKRIRQAQVNNPDIVQLVPLSPNQVQMSALRPGVTQVNLWDENGTVYAIDVLVFGDARELELLLQQEFPNAALKVRPVSAKSVLISGYVDQPDHVQRITTIADQYYTTVLTNITVGGAQQVLLHVRVMEVSRTKLRNLGFDFAKLTNGNLVASTVSGMISAVSSTGEMTVGGQSFMFNVVNGNSAFFGVLDALRQDNLLKIMAEPTLVTVSGRPAFFHSGGSFPILVPQSMGSVSVEFKNYGTQVDFVPIVLGNGKIRLEVRPSVSELDLSNSIHVGDLTVPGIRTREVDTGVELSAGQTLALAGLVQERTESERRGLPWVSEVPYLGALFRNIREERNEIELLIMVTPELVEGMEASEVPPGGPGTQTTNPNDIELYLRGHLEVPRCSSGVPMAPMPQTQGPETIPAPDPRIPGSPATTRNSGAGNSPAADGRYTRQNPQNPQGQGTADASTAKRELPGFRGPMGYDVIQ